jgi:hypothetical protein
VPERAREAQATDASLGAADFTALLDALGLAAPPRGSRPPPAEARVVALAPNPAAARTIVAKIAPWFATLAVLGVTAAAIEPLAARHRLVGTAILLVIAVGGMAVTVARAMRTSPALSLRLGRGTLEVVEPSGRSLGAAPLEAVTSKAGTARFSSRGTTYDYPSLAIDVGGRATVTVGVYDARFLWRGGATFGRAPRYIAGAPDWIALAVALGHGARLPDAASGQVPS